MKVAMYAWYSPDDQRDASIADQLRICREFAPRERPLDGLAQAQNAIS